MNTANGVIPWVKHLGERVPELLILAAVVYTFLQYLDTWTQAAFESQKAGITALGEMREAVAEDASATRELLGAFRAEQTRREREHEAILDHIERSK